MKRYIIFAGLNYEARGGWSDIVRGNNGGISSTDSIVEARRIKTEAKSRIQTALDPHKEIPSDVSWSQIVDLHTGLIVS